MHVIDTGTERPEVWKPLTRWAFRFTTAYLGLFCLLFAQMLFVFTGIAADALPSESVVWQMRMLAPVTEWVGAHVFGVEATLRMNGSGDQRAIWVFMACVLASAVLVTVVWSVLDRRRTAYPRAAAWLVTGARLCLGGQMLMYGLGKLVPTQMPYPSLATLVRPYGEQSAIDVLWNQVGAAPAYQMALGAAEVLAGLLLFLPRTATVGALLSLVSMAMVFLLNMTYDVPVKILSFHLLMLSLAILAPQARRLANVLLLERPAEPAR